MLLLCSSCLVFFVNFVVSMINRQSNKSRVARITCYPCAKRKRLPRKYQMKLQRIFEAEEAPPGLFPFPAASSFGLLGFAPGYSIRATRGFSSCSFVSFVVKNFCCGSAAPGPSWIKGFEMSGLKHMIHEGHEVSRRSPKQGLKPSCPFVLLPVIFLTRFCS